MTNTVRYMGALIPYVILIIITVHIDLSKQMKEGQILMYQGKGGGVEKVKCKRRIKLVD